MNNRKIFINTIGCQMNVYDSRRILQLLEPLGYSEIGSPKGADLILLNTCTIREKAEQKAFSFLGRLAAYKRKNPDLIVAVGGCVAQQEGENILRRAPMVDLVFGTQALERLPRHIREIEVRGCRIVDVESSKGIQEPDFSSQKLSGGDVCAFVTIMRGCENFCSYCVVPYVRGPEISREPQKIVEEIRCLVDSGVREVTLLGQNVNSYGKKQGLCEFADLLNKVNEIEGLRRIRFTTSHPKDLSRKLMEAFVECDKLCRHIHLPVQSGSNRILKKMNRKYTRQDYTEKIEALRRISPDIAITSDIIVGFPGESEEDFIQTMTLIETIGYDSLFAFKYSDRPNAPAVKFGSKIGEKEKAERLQKVLSLQQEITLEKNRKLIGTIQEILVEGTSKRNREGSEASTHVHWTGRTSTNRVVNFSVDPAHWPQGDRDLTGSLVDVKIIEAFSNSLWCKPVRIETGGSVS